MAREDVKYSLFKAISHIDNRDLLAQHLPDGRLWEGKFDSTTNIGKLILGLAVEYYRLGLMLEKNRDEMNINSTNDLLMEWEISMGIPSDIFDNTVDITTRRTNIKYLLGNFGGVQTAEDFERVAAYFGYTVEVYPGLHYGTFPFTFPFLFFSSVKEVKFTILVLMDLADEDYVFPFTFPLTFSSGGTIFIQNLFDILKPANCQVLLRNKES